MSIDTHPDISLDYSKVVFRGMKEKVCFVCHKKDANGVEHGEFWQLAGNHIRLHQGCPKCGIEISAMKRRAPYQKQIERARSIHGNKYIYPDMDSVNNSTKIPIECPLHGVFWMDLNGHLDGKQGCPKCDVERRKRLKYGVGINDLLYAENDVAYKYWHSMLCRCYDKKFHTKEPSYIGCSVCPEWLYFSNFKKWFDENYIEGCHLDKDILVKGNKIYSPQTCCFVPQKINSLIAFRKNISRGLPTGVTKRNGKYIASSRDVNGCRHSRSYCTMQEAIDAYIRWKDSVIKETAILYFERGDITKNVFDALMNWKIEISDCYDK